MSDLEARRQKLAEMREARLKKASAAVAAASSTPAAGAATGTTTPQKVMSTDSLSDAASPVPQQGATPTPQAASPSPSLSQAQLTKCTSLAPVNVCPAKVEQYSRGCMTDTVYAPEPAPVTTPSNTSLSAPPGEPQQPMMPAVDLEQLVQDAIRRTLYPIKGSMIPEDALKVSEGADIGEFTSRATFIVQRTLSSTMEMSLEGALGVDSGAKGHNQLVSKRRTFVSDAVTNKVVGCIAFQGGNEYFAVSYTNTSQAEGGDDMLVGDTKAYVLVWSTKQPTPVLEFTADSEVTALTYSPFHPHALLGGCANGLVVTWDLRKGSKPVDQSFPSYEGHNRTPIITAIVVGKQNHNYLTTASQDGRFCLWEIGNMTFPSASFDVALLGKGILVNAASVPTTGLTKFYIGTTNGKLLKGARAGSSAGTCEVKQLDWETHRSTVSSMDCHPKISKLILSASVDSTVRLSYDRDGSTGGSVAAAAPATSGGEEPSSGGGEGEGDVEAQRTTVNSIVIENFSDFVYDAQWSPVHPSVFAACDGSGTLTFWNLCSSVTAPIASLKLAGLEGSTASSGAVALNRISWDTDGTHVVVGNSIGEVYLVSVGADLSQHGSTELNAFSDLIGNLFGEAQAAEALMSRGEAEDEEEKQ